MGSRLVVTPGDPDGIGPEVVWKAIVNQHTKWKSHSLLCVGARKPFDALGARVISAELDDLTPPKESKPFVWLLETPTQTDPKLLLEGYQAGWAIETAASLVGSGEFDALVTGPIHKERLNLGGYAFTGHTDFLAALSAEPPLAVTMMLANSTLRVSLVTTHVSLAQVSPRITREALFRATEQTLDALLGWWGIKKPRVAICALNPHAGEAGLFGREEIDVIAPAITELRKKWGTRAEIVGPLPADTLFANHVNAKPGDRADAVVALYHDQGLIPVKLIDFPHTVNITLGLPFIRTSVDHGTGFDIAGKNLADPRSFESATELALQLIQKRKKS
ncbi:MAG: 4-hydroxythreonine-4-phosphate dehydrogenase PdxA [Cryobacterium sp.]|nr:4-hydroxythreonine-4-phosphate dehydrogenase PdxA [Oligoflexia bacterium]